MQSFHARFLWGAAAGRQPDSPARLQQLSVRNSISAFICPKFGL
jgi:hypothetical protein